MPTKPVPVPSDAAARALELVEQAREILHELQSTDGTSDPRFTLLFGMADAWERKDAGPVFLAAHDLIEGFATDLGMESRVRADIVRILERFSHLSDIDYGAPSEEDTEAASALVVALDDLAMIIRAFTSLVLLEGDRNKHALRLWHTYGCAS